MGRRRGLNYVVDTNKIWSDVPLFYENLINYGDEYEFRHIGIISTLDEPIILQFNSSFNTLVVIPNLEIALDDFKHYGLIEWRAEAEQPTIGFFKMSSW